MNEFTSKLFKDLITKEELDKFNKLQKVISKLNKYTNLTRLIDGSDYWISQVYDSIWPYRKNSEYALNNKKIIDIGSGCGFPGLAYAITHPKSEIFLIDSSKKKTDALKEIILELNLKNQIYVIKDRIENLAHNSLYRNSFDICMTRAVGCPSTVTEYILPMLNKKGIGILYCGKWNQEEQNKIEKSLMILKGSIINKKKHIFLQIKGKETSYSLNLTASVQIYILERLVNQ